MKILFLFTTLMVSTTVNATTLDFESYTDIGGLYYSSLSEDGYTVSYDNSKRFSGWGTNDPLKNGNVIVDAPFFEKIRLVKDDGGLFSANSIDLVSASFTDVFDLIFTGVKENNQTVSQTFTLSELANPILGGTVVTFNFNNFTGLKKLSWYGSEWPKSYGFDNINVTEYVSAPVSSVPVPMAFWLFASGLPLIAFKAKRKQS